MYENTLIEVTQEDINNGEKCSAYNCPVSLAAKRKLKVDLATAYSYMDIYPEDIRFNFCSRVSVRLPSIVSDWISNFDQKKPVKPFSFRLGPEFVEEE